MFDPFAALPFLPAGEGPLILVFGGLAVLGVAVPWSVMSSRSIAPPTARQGGPDPAGVPEARIVHTAEGHAATGAEGGAAWARALPDTASRSGLGAAWLISGDALRAQLLLTQCQTCVRRRRRGCEPERRRLEAAARAILPRARVREVACNRRGACTFEVRRGAGR